MPNISKKIMKISGLLSIVLTISGVLISCNKSSNDERGAVRNVILANIEYTGGTSENTFSGVVEEGKSVNAAFMTGGKIMSLNAKEGDRVRKGQLLASLDDSDYQIGVNQLKVQFQQMTAEKKRMDEMYNRHNVAPNDYEKFEAGYEQLKLQLEMANNKLSYTKLYSPSDGFVSYKFMEPGELVDAGTPIYKIIDDSQLEVSVDLPLNIYLNRTGIKNVYGILPSVSEKIPLKISSFTPDADNNQLYKMKLTMPLDISKNITTGMNISVLIEMLNDSEGETLIPSRSIFNDGDKNFVWVINPMDSVISRKQITVEGAPKGGYNLVKGLSGNEMIVSAGVKQLKDGEKVNIIESPLQ